MTVKDLVGRLRILRSHHYDRQLAESVPNGYWPINPRAADFHRKQVAFLDELLAAAEAVENKTPS